MNSSCLCGLSRTNGVGRARQSVTPIASYPWMHRSLETRSSSCDSGIACVFVQTHGFPQI